MYFSADDPEDVIIAAARRLDSGNFPLTQVHPEPLAARSENSPMPTLGRNTICPDRGL